MNTTAVVWVLSAVWFAYLGKSFWWIFCLIAVVFTFWTINVQVLMSPKKEKKDESTED